MDADADALPAARHGHRVTVAAASSRALHTIIPRADRGTYSNATCQRIRQSQQKVQNLFRHVGKTVRYIHVLYAKSSHGHLGTALDYSLRRYHDIASSGLSGHPLLQCPCDCRHSVSPLANTPVRLVLQSPRS